MKFDKYKLASAVGIALVIIVIVVFTQRSDWDANKYILSADDSGNLEPKSEKYFDDKEKALLAAVDQKIAAVNSRITGVDNKVNVQRRDFNNRAGHVDRHFATKAEFNRLDAWHRGLGAWTDGRYQPKGDYVRKDRTVALKLQNGHEQGGNTFMGGSRHHYQMKWGYGSGTNFILVQ